MEAKDVIDATAKDSLAASALALFSQRGFNATSLRLIATKAGLSVGLIAYHFGSKEGLRESLDEEILWRLKHVAAPPDNEDDTLLAFLKRLAVVANSHARIGDYIFRSLEDTLQEDHHPFRVALHQIIDEGLMRLGRQGCLAPSVDPHWRATQVLTLLFGFSPSSRQRTVRCGLPGWLDANVQLLARGFSA